MFSGNSLHSPEFGTPWPARRFAGRRGYNLAGRFAWRGGAKAGAASGGRSLRGTLIHTRLAEARAGVVGECTLEQGIGGREAGHGVIEGRLVDETGPQREFAFSQIQQTQFTFTGSRKDGRGGIDGGWNHPLCEGRRRLLEHEDRNRKVW